MNQITDKVICETPTPGKKSTRIDRWKYELVRKAILKVLPSKGQGVEFKELTDLVKKQLSQDDLSRLGSSGWYTTVVKLDMEVKDDIRRIPGSSPQRLLKVQK